MSVYWVVTYNQGIAVTRGTDYLGRLTATQETLQVTHIHYTWVFQFTADST